MITGISVPLPIVLTTIITTFNNSEGLIIVAMEQEPTPIVSITDVRYTTQSSQCVHYGRIVVAFLDISISTPRAAFMYVNKWILAHRRHRAPRRSN